jgi:ribosome-associated protein
VRSTATCAAGVRLWAARESSYRRVVPDDRFLRVTPTCRIPIGELDVHASRSGGPGGQHANTSDTRVEVRFDIARSPSLGPRQRARLLQRLGPTVRAVASDSRSQARNRELALERLRRRLADGLHVERARRPTRPSRAARAARVDAKKRRGDVKRRRARPSPDD